MAIEEMLGNPDHVCRNPGCGEPMPLPANWGNECPHCHYRQPTLDELARSVTAFRKSGKKVIARATTFDDIATCAGFTNLAATRGLVGHQRLDAEQLRAMQARIDALEAEVERLRAEQDATREQLADDADDAADGLAAGEQLVDAGGLDDVADLDREVGGDVDDAGFPRMFDLGALPRHRPQPVVQGRIEITHDLYS